MSASDIRAGRTSSRAADTAAGDAADSLARTLEDLEVRLSRLSEARRDAPAEGGVKEKVAHAAAETRSMTARLRSVAEERLSGASRLALDASGAGEEPSGRRRRAGALLERRMGTIAGEVEALKMQGSTLQLVSGIAEDIQQLKTEIVESVAAHNEAGFEEIRGAFEDLCERIAEADRSGDIGTQVDAIMRRLADMQATRLDRKALDVLRDDLETVGRLAAAAAREESLTAATRRWDDFEVRLESHIELDGTAKRELQAELERLRETVRSLATEDQVRAIERRWDEFEARHFEKLRNETEGRFTRLLRAELKTLSERIDFLAESAIAAEVDRSERAETAERTNEALHRLSVRLEELEDALEELPEILAVERLEVRLEELGASVAAIAREQAEPDLEHFMILEERLDEISEALVSTALRDAKGVDMAPIERIEARLAELSARVDGLTSAGDTKQVSRQIAELSARVEEMATSTGGVASEAQFASFSARIEAAIARMVRPGAETAMFEQRLTALADRLEEVAAAQVDEEVLRSLESQIARLGLQLSEGLSLAQPESPVDLERRLQSLEERLDQNREEVMIAARAAADEAVRLVLEQGPNREGDHIRNLSEDLRSLEALCRETDDRSIKVFDAVHSTLVKIADRLTVIEAEVRSDQPGRTQAAPARLPDLEAVMPAFDTLESGRASERERSGRLGRKARETDGEDRAAAAVADFSAALSKKSEARTTVEETPSLDLSAENILTREANRPLEPGSGTPDIASLIDRVRLQQQRFAGEAAEPAAKADFIAAARKAALAAAAEAETLRAEDASDRNGEALPASTAGGRFSRHRKPILMAVGAVLLAMMAIPLGRVMTVPGTTNGTVETAALQGEATSVPALPAPVPPAAAPVRTTAATQTPATPARPAAAQPTDVSPQAAAPRTAAAPARAVQSEPSIAALAAARAASSGERTFETASLVSPAAMAPVRPVLVEPAPAPVEVKAEAPAAPRRASAEATAVDPNPVLSEAIMRLPEAARARVAQAPSGIGSTALVAASDEGDPKAIFEIGLRLMEGRSGESDIEGALNWFARSGTLGYAPAQYSLGTLFEKGNGVERDTIAARDWYSLAAEQGNVRAMHNLAVLYATGIDGKSDPQSAARWFTEAAEHGMRDSQYNLGILHARGSGVEQDLGQSYKWFSIVGAAGDRDAAEKRDEVAKALTADQIAAIDAEVKSWQPKARDEAVNSVDIPPAWMEEPGQTASIDMTRAVRNVQAILIKLGFDPGTPDGIAGTRTTEAVRAFQEQNGLETSGQIDETLIRELLKRNV